MIQARPPNRAMGKVASRAGVTRVNVDTAPTAAMTSPVQASQARGEPQDQRRDSHPGQEKGQTAPRSLPRRPRS